MGVLHAFPAPETAVPHVPRVEHPSPSLTLIASTLLNENRASRVLDLGPAFGANLDFYSQIARKIHIEDLHETLFGETVDGRGRRQLMSELLPYRNEMRFDLIMCWDILNYLCPEEINALSNHLQKFCRPGAILCALIHTRKEMPAHPTHFRICPNQKISYEYQTSELIAGPRYSKVELQKFLGPFTRMRSLLLRNGYEEQIYVRE